MKFLLVLFVLGAMLLKDAKTHHHADSYDDYHADEEYQDISKDLEQFENSIENLEKEKQGLPKAVHHYGRQLNVNNKSDNRYEITENVIDIPNNETLAGPVITNYTVTKLLNTIANASNSNSLNNQPNKETVRLKPKKHTFSIFHIKAEFEDDKPNQPNLDLISPTQVFNFNNAGIREYLNGVQRGLANGINSLVNKNLEYGVNKGVYVPGVVAGPVKYLQSLQKKGSDAVREFHNVVFGNRVLDRYSD